MVYISTLLIFLASGGWLFSETTIIKQYIINVRDYNPPLFSGLPYWYYSSDALMQSNNPFPSKFMGYSKVEYDQIYKDRFCDLVGIPETMIAGVPILGVRPFFFNIDKNLLPILSSWEWGGGSDYPFTVPGYIVPSAQGYFNQAEQRFYVSDGRQYQVVPEPTSFSLLLAGLVLLINRRRLKNAIT